ncbi:nucleotidyltransferase family protein [Candidatus Gottesmanbacteria bacterium]|nr:nucleotidyltransferase family protein [Candidatus Gottesmanbacteria bacterium]
MDDLFDAAQLKSICEQNGIIYLGLFGSHARGEQEPDSDVDLLVEYEKPVGYLTHAKIQNTLEDYLNKPVDLVFRSSIKPRIKPYIMKDLKTVYEKR